MGFSGNRIQGPFWKIRCSSRRRGVGEKMEKIGVTVDLVAAAYACPEKDEHRELSCRRFRRITLFAISQNALACLVG